MTAYLRPGQRGRGVPGRRLRIPAQAVRRRPGGRTGPPRAWTKASARRWPRSAWPPTPEMLGQAPAMQEVFRAIGRLSQSHVDGADHRRVRHRQGTGGARAARPQPARGQALRRASTSRRSRRTCSSPSCSATSAAPSPARRRMRRGRFEQADGGTLFLDEIGDMPPTCRRACCACCPTASSTASAATRRSRPTCASSPPPTRTWSSACKEGLFREDLFHRLNVIRLRLPPLRERREDIPMLARHFLQQERAANSAWRPSASPMRR